MCGNKGNEDTLSQMANDLLVREKEIKDTKAQLVIKEAELRQRALVMNVAWDFTVTPTLEEFLAHPAVTKMLEALKGRLKSYKCAPVLIALCTFSESKISLNMLEGRLKLLGFTYSSSTIYYYILSFREPENLYIQVVEAGPMSFPNERRHFGYKVTACGRRHAVAFAMLADADQWIIDSLLNGFAK